MWALMRMESVCCENSGGTLMEGGFEKVLHQIWRCVNDTEQGNHAP
jgi:hypothetical protein